MNINPNCGGPMKKIFSVIIMLVLFQALAAYPVLVEEQADNIQSGDRLLYHNGSTVIQIMDTEAFSAPGKLVVDENYRVGEYYLVTKANVSDIKSEWGKVIYQFNNDLLIKSADNPIISMLELGLKCIPLREIVPPATEKHLNPASVRYRNEIDDIISLIEVDSLESTIQSLEDFGTRFCFHPNHEIVAEWIRQEFLALEIPAGYMEFTGEDLTHYDVIGQINGSVHPERFLMIGGHYDSIVNQGDPMTGAPGADDNASSVAATLEVARVIMESGYQPRNTILFCAFAAEEVGLWGSYVMADVLTGLETDLAFVLNNDMIANNSNSPSEWYMNIVQYTGYEYLCDLSQALIPQYSNVNMGYVGENSPSSDSYPFFVYGFPVVYYLEGEFSPWYHSLDDTIEHCDVDYCTEIAKVDLAMLITMDMMPVEITGLQAWDNGDGESVLLQWNTSIEPQIEEYNVYAGNQPGIYTQNFTTTDTLLTVTGLNEEELTYLGVSVYTIDGLESFITETSITPLSIPLSPQEFSAEPTHTGISLCWLPNNELDIAGYNIFRKIATGTEFELINAEPVVDTIYVDIDTSPLEYYHYYTQAVDIEGNSSLASAEVISRMATLDQGILLVDLTNDLGSGFGNPDPIDWHNFYEALMLGFTPEYYDLEVEEILPDYELAVYSTVMLCQDRNALLPGMADILPALQKYLQLGGNLILSGFRPIDSFFGCSEFPCEFEPDHPINAMFGIAGIDYSQNARLLNAEPFIPNFAALQVDPDKTLPYFENHLPFIEVYNPAANADSLYWWDSEYEDDTSFGMMNGRNIVIYNDNVTYKTAVISFPLFNMYQSDARQFISTLLTEYMEEEVDLTESVIITGTPLLKANFPNPFNPETTITFSLPEAADTELAIYNIKGQKVVTLANGFLSEGRHDLIWQGKDEFDNPVASGIYFYRLRSAGNIQTRKMLMLK
jgi:Peptidase family M28/FlgD Ig-like domain